MPNGELGIPGREESARSLTYLWMGRFVLSKFLSSFSPLFDCYLGAFSSDTRAHMSNRADVAELADARGSDLSSRKGVEVQVLSSARIPFIRSNEVRAFARNTNTTRSVGATEKPCPNRPSPTSPPMPQNLPALRFPWKVQDSERLREFRLGPLA